MPEGESNIEKTIIKEFDLEECNSLGGMPWIFYKLNGKSCQEPVIISFKDIFTLFRNEGIEPDDKHDRYHFTKTSIALGNNWVIELDPDTFFTAREINIVE